ncbi:amino acid adenylation domain-containing protein [Streptomyces tubbatahanensis]|uniref:Amino acid adenylation domain-containing protein n=1 Tax=Streptomyces tubbatahanensis TaxID=2923272 RepID=A0ABY3XZU0_9ACTN|nr:amino acid adenylation domain-containing protein [Streptomyces tubbatahanensis]UNS99803.1 amino acid adenylation domain-containing protein [Streptomyces tubbatahanensis]
MDTPCAVIRLRRDFPREQAERPAFVGAQPLTYRELTTRVDALSVRLLDFGVRPGDRTAVWMDKQPRYAEAILATLDVGCAYVPLDGGQPRQRAQTILADAEPVVLFTDARHLALLGDEPLPSSLELVVVDDETPVKAVGEVPVRPWREFTEAAAHRIALLPAVGPTDLAAILYTSGSTGAPKGVRLSHRNLANFVGWARTELDVGPRDVFANHASFNFDLSTFDLFTALTVGAAVWIVGDSAARDVTALAAGIREHGVTVWYSVPSILSLLTASGALTCADARSLRYVLFAGEVFPIPRLRALAELLPQETALYNLYGPTETNVCAFHRVRPEDLERRTPVPIGGPVTGAGLRVVDNHGALVSEPGVIGHLVVEGVCVTPGYWRRTADPATAFHCAGRHPTGDLVSYEEDGRLVYRGREDRMVKLSGYRIELGEIEAAAQHHPDIADAAVLLAGEGPQARLALYYTLCPGAPKPSLVQLKQHCARWLPVYMLPHTATCLDQLPRNANGKADYRRLANGTARPIAAPTGAARQ